MPTPVRRLAAERLEASDGRAEISEDRPVLFTAGCRDWPAFGKWNQDFFHQRHGKVVVPVSRYAQKGHEAEGDRLKLSLGDILSIYEDPSSPKRFRTHGTQAASIDPEMYVAGWHFLRDLPELDDDILIPRLFADNLLPFVNDHIIEYDWKSIFIGSASSHTPVHTDSFYVGVWLALLEGEKTIRYVSSSAHAEMGDRPDLFSQESVASLARRGVSVHEAKLVAGDIAYHPPGWWHQVRNHSFNVAVSFNYISPAFYLPFEQQLLAKAVAPILLRLLELRERIETAPSCSSQATANALSSSGYCERSLRLEQLLSEMGAQMATSRNRVDISTGS